MKMDVYRLKNIVDQIDKHSKQLQTSFLKENNSSFDSIFNNYNSDKVLGELIFEALTDLVTVSKISWVLDRDEFKEWIDEIFDEFDEMEEI